MQPFCQFAVLKTRNKTWVITLRFTKLFNVWYFCWYWIQNLSISSSSVSFYVPSLSINGSIALVTEANFYEITKINHSVIWTQCSILTETSSIEKHNVRHHQHFDSSSAYHDFFHLRFIHFSCHTNSASKCRYCWLTKPRWEKPWYALLRWMLSSVVLFDEQYFH